MGEIYVKRIPLLSVLVLAIIFTFFQGNNKVEAAINNKPGDIIVTQSTSFKGIAGHVGIYVSSTEILHTSGWKSEPYPRIITESQWHKRYTKGSKVIRPTSSTLGSKAASNAKKYFLGKKINYKITSNPKDIDPNTYCSELVWYSYYKSGKTFQTRYDAPQTGGSWVTPSIIYPYNFINSSYVSHNGFKFIDNKW